MSTSYLDAKAAAERLGVTRATLYAYVSRGVIRSRVEPGRRSRQYYAEDVERWLKQQSGRRDPGRIAEQALFADGLPVLSSSLSLIDAGKLYYRGQEVIALSRERSFEEVIGLLWGGDYQPPSDVYLPSAAEQKRGSRLHFAAACQCWLAQAEARDLGAYNLNPEAVRRTGARIVAGLSALGTGASAAPRSLATALGRAWGVKGRPGVRALEATLIICADHELNVSAFSARAIASAGATPYMAVSGALAALTGFRHGGHLERVAALLDESGEPAWVIAERLRRGQGVPGFGHILYPDGDPRGRALLELCPKNAARARAQGFVEAARSLLGAEPTLDLGLIALARSLGLPASAAFKLFALGRSAGWLAHCIEQYATGELIRPRARYVGPPPAAPS
ncbi:MAG: citrate synthase family protein [Polyangiaceae bacterium]